MKNFKIIAVLFSVFIISTTAFAQNSGERITGTVLSYGSGFNTRTSTNQFDLTINEQTSDADAQRFLGLLQTSGQTELLDAIKGKEVGRFSFTGSVARDVNVIREKETNGMRHIYVVFERWMQVGELRGGYRSIDYPFTYMELMIDPRTGKGEGTFIAAAQIRWKKDKDTGAFRVEVEDFATFPSRLLNVRTNIGRR